MAPAVVMRPILFPMISVNHRAPSGPAQMLMGTPGLLGTAYSSVTTGPEVARPILLAADSQNHRAPSGPVQIPSGWEPGSGTWVNEPMDQAPAGAMNSGEAHKARAMEIHSSIRIPRMTNPFLSLHYVPLNPQGSQPGNAVIVRYFSY